MKPQTEAFFEKANELLSQTETMLGVGLTDAAGRTAYLAGFHAAQGFLFEQEDKVFKTHKGVQTEFNRVVKDDPRFDLTLRIFLGKTYNLKAIADYETGPGATVSAAQATEALAAARVFVAHLANLLGGQTT